MPPRAKQPRHVRQTRVIQLLQKQPCMSTGQPQVAGNLNDVSHATHYLGCLLSEAIATQPFSTSAMSDSALTQAHVFVSGTVQGVAYRAYTRQQATDLGVAGWVRNLRDGRVEAVFEGSPTIVEQMVQWCHSGSPAATVTNVDVTYGKPTGLQGFEVRYTQ